MPTAIDVTTLPVTGAVVPAAAASLTVKPIGRMATSCGEAFRAEVRDGDRLIGLIENEGRGGGTWFQHNERADRAAFDALVAAYDAVHADAEPWERGEEAFCEALHEEVALARDLNRKRNAVVMLDGDRARILVYNAPLSDALRRGVKAANPGREVMVWVKGSGWDVA